MKYPSRIISLIAVILLLTASLTGCNTSQPTDSNSGSSGEAGDVIAPDWSGATMTLGTLNPESNPDSQAAQWFADTLAEKTEGRLQINVFPHSQLGNQSVQIEALTMGTQDFFVGGMEPFASIAPELNALNIFYLFESDEHLQAFFSSDYYQTVEEELAAENIVDINQAHNWVKGPYRILMTTKEIDGSLESIKGMTIRIPEQEVFQKSWSALGATPIALALNETYLALDQGLVEGLDLIPASIASNGFQEVVKYIMRTDAFPQREGVMMAKSSMDKLPVEIQELIYETADEAGEYYTQLVLEASEEIMGQCEDLGITVIDDADLTDWYAACADLGYELEETGYIPKGLTDAIKGMK